jgi:hypothetical protein
MLELPIELDEAHLSDRVVTEEMPLLAWGKTKICLSQGTTTPWVKRGTGERGRWVPMAPLLGRGLASTTSSLSPRFLTLERIEAHPMRVTIQTAPCQDANTWSRKMTRKPCRPPGSVTRIP